AALPSPGNFSAPPVVSQTTCGGKSYKYHGLAGYGFVPSNAKDRFGDTLGGIGSALAIDQSIWRRNKDSTYEGIAFGLPDRGWYSSPDKFSTGCNFSLPTVNVYI